MLYQTDSSRWRAVQSRDELAASAFVYAVITTKIFCRPSCPSRLARRANVCFYDTVAAAKDAGYRPCRRCKPDHPLASHLDNKVARREAVERVCRFMEQADTTVRFVDAAKHVNLSPRYLHGLFKDIMGMTPAKYAQVYRSSQGLDCLSETSFANETCDTEAVSDLFLFDINPADLSSTIDADWQVFDPATATQAVDQHLQLENVHLDFSTGECTMQGATFVPNEFDIFFDDLTAAAVRPRDNEMKS